MLLLYSNLFYQEDGHNKASINNWEFDNCQSFILHFGSDPSKYQYTINYCGCI